MNSQTTLLIASILAFALFANISAPVFATGGLDDEEEEEAIEQLQNDIDELKDALGNIELNLTSGANDITANCPATSTPEEEQPDSNITETTPPEQNTTETPVEETPQCPFAPPAVEEEEPVTPPQQTAIQPFQNLTCPFVPPVVEENTTEVIEEVIENITQGQTCNVPQEFLPGIVLPNVTEPQEPEPPVVEQNVTDPDEVLICPLTGLPIGQPMPPAAVEEPAQQLPEVAAQEEPPIQDEQAIGTIEFEESCGCFVIDKSPE